MGIGIPALVQSDNRTVFYSGIMEIEEGTYDMFHKFIHYEISMFNDAKASCFAEKWVNKDIRNAFYILLSNNVGGAMIINGQVYSGNNFRAAEVGHITLVPQGRQCYCGQCGCVDPYLAATNLSRDDLAGYFKNLETTADRKTLDNWDRYLDYMAATVNNVRGFRFKGPNGNTIFFPMTGYKYDTTYTSEGSHSYIWLSNKDIVTNVAYKAMSIYFYRTTSSGGAKTTAAPRRSGVVVRAVRAGVGSTNDFAFDTDGIFQVTTMDTSPSDDATYTLQGIKVEGNLKPGIYIRGGKKFTVK